MVSSANLTIGGDALEYYVGQCVMAIHTLPWGSPCQLCFSVVAIRMNFESLIYFP